MGLGSDFLNEFIKELLRKGRPGVLEGLGSDFLIDFGKESLRKGRPGVLEG